MVVFIDLVSSIPWYAAGTGLACALVAGYVIRPVLGGRVSLFRRFSAASALLSGAIFIIVALALAVSLVAVAQQAAIIAFASLFVTIVSFAAEAFRDATVSGPIRDEDAR